MPETLLQVTTIADLKAQPLDTNVKVFVQSYISLGDGLGGMYYWDSSSTLAEDMVFLNTITSNVSSSGRWVRLNQRARSIPQGYFTQNGNVKEVFINAVTDGNGRATVNLTTDNTPTGPSIFTEVWDNRSYATDPQTVNTSVRSCVYANPAGLKTTTHQFSKPNQILALLAFADTPVAAGVAVRFIVKGV